MEIISMVPRTFPAKYMYFLLGACADAPPFLPLILRT